VNYCGIAVGPRAHHLCALREVRADEPPVRLAARFYEPGPAPAVAAAVRALGEVVVAIGAPMTRGERECDRMLARLGVRPVPFSDDGAALFEHLSDLGLFGPEGDGREGDVAEGAFQTRRVFETNAEAVFSALHNRRLPARRHPFGIARRIDELAGNQVVDDGGGLWNRRVDELDATAAAVCAHRFAVGHARWIGDPAEGVLVLPGSGRLERFGADGVLPPVTRVPL
jgi:predicted nuclease with RNAse H fold